MQYFTQDLWSKMNSNIEKEKIETDVKWCQNSRAYWERFKGLENRFSKKAFKILTKHDFHDYQIEGLKIIHGNYWVKDPVKVEIIISSQKQKWLITYKKVKKISINYEQNDGLYFAERIGFDTWGYDELLDVNKEIISHEILFASYATITIYFPNKNLFIDKLSIVNN